ncbi:hypothetical protein RIF29_37174 [Crotalaria pallida]|uniref:U1 small nuclear ribonucleoprotein of 70kDa N-terminal domain-containing protein n=1 Tax=Crotalaria pallida TaxID=3830 RepID=A0AAN9HV17_CROPI
MGSEISSCTELSLTLYFQDVFQVQVYKMAINGHAASFVLYFIFCNMVIVYFGVYKNGGIDLIITFIIDGSTYIESVLKAFTVEFASSSPDGAQIGSASPFTMGDFNNDPLLRNQNATVQARAKAQNRANVLQLKLIGQSHPTGLTSNLLKLFEPRPPLEFKPPPEKRKCPPLTGMAQLVSKFAEPDDPEYAPPVKEAETPAQKRARIHKAKLEAGAAKAAEELEKYDPHSDPNVSGDPYKTLFVAKLSYETTESRIKREFESYGPIKRVGIF